MTLDRYVFVQWLKAFALAVPVTAGVLLLENLQNELEDFLRWGAQARELATFYLSYLTMRLPLVVPLSLLLSVLYVMGNLHRNREVTAMRAAGLGLLRIARTLFAATLLLTALLFLLNAHWVPRATEHTERLRKTWALRHEAAAEAPDDAGLVERLGFADAASGRLWFMNRFSRYTNQAFGVNVYIRDDRGRDLRRIGAREAYFDEAARHWVFLEGVQLHFDPATGEAIRRLRFDRHDEPTFREPPSVMLALHRKPATLSLFEIQDLLARTRGANEAILRPYQLRQYTVLSQPADALAVVILVLPLAVGGVRRSPLIGTGRAVGAVAAYFLASSTIAALAMSGTLALNAVAWLPLVMVGAAAVVLYRREV